MEATQTLDFDYAPDFMEEPGTAADVSVDTEVESLSCSNKTGLCLLVPTAEGTKVCLPAASSC